MFGKKKKAYRELVKAHGEIALALVRANPSQYIPTLGSYLKNDTFFGILNRWHQRGDASHSSCVFIDKNTCQEVVEVHALEGWGVIVTVPGFLGKKGAVLELRGVFDGPTTEEVLLKIDKVLGAKYQKPFGFITKTRKDDPLLWFCSELQNHFFQLQRCDNLFVSPVWARRSPLAEIVIKRIYC